MKKIVLMMLVAMVPFMTMAQKKSKKGKKNKIEKVDNSNATYEFMVISGYEREIDKDASRRGTAQVPAEMKGKKFVKVGSKVMVHFDFGTRSQENVELMKNTRSYKTMA